MTITIEGQRKQRPKQGKRTDFPRLLGGKICLDFVNTIEGRLDPHPVEFLNSYEDVVHWAEHASMLNPAQCAAILEVAKKSPEKTTTYFEKAIELREALYRIFLAQAHKAKPPQSDIEHLKGAYIEALNHARLSQSPHGYAWRWPDNDVTLEALLWPLTKAAIDLLGSSDVERIKECPGADDCGWLFFDESKNRSRRWCSMEGCGSRVKMRHQYARLHNLNSEAQNGAN